MTQFKKNQNCRAPSIYVESYLLIGIQRVLPDKKGFWAKPDFWIKFISNIRQGLRTLLTTKKIYFSLPFQIYDLKCRKK